MKKKSSTNFKLNYKYQPVLFFSFLIFLAISYLFYWNMVVKQTTGYVKKKETDIHQKSVIGKSPEVTIVKQGVCQNSVLGLRVTLLNGWTCNIGELSELDGFIELNSDLFTVNISNLGRGPYCGGGEKQANTDESCTTSAFFQNDKVNLTLFKYYGENKEIFGGIVPLNNIETLGKTWISVKYKNMENLQLTESQKQELIELLNTIEVLN